MQVVFMLWFLYHWNEKYITMAMERKHLKYLESWKWRESDSNLERVLTNPLEESTVNTKCKINARNALMHGHDL